MQPARAECYARIKMQILDLCNHEEAYSRVIIHAFDAGRKGRQKLLIRTVDTDILVLAIAYVESFDAQELWIIFVTGKKVGYLAGHGISQALGLAKSRALLIFHAFTGCDTVSIFAGKCKTKLCIRR